MGQYHSLVNFDKKEYVTPHSIGLGSKQWEHQGDREFPLFGSLSDALYILVMTSPYRGGGDMPLTQISGRWAGDRVMVLGDYTKDGDLAAEMAGGSLNDLVLETYTEIGAQVREAFEIVYNFVWHSREGFRFTCWERKEKVKAVSQ